MLVYINGQIIDSDEGDLLVIGLTEKEKSLLQNLTPEQNTLALYDGTKHNTNDVQTILNMLKIVLKKQKNNNVEK